MRVKVGETWHCATADTPIAVELSSADRRNIAAMAPEATRYGCFEKGPMTSEQMSAWLGR